jgi:hypothetical protein
MPPETEELLVEGVIKELSYYPVSDFWSEKDTVWVIRIDSNIIIGVVQLREHVAPYILQRSEAFRADGHEFEYTAWEWLVVRPRMDK